MKFLIKSVLSVAVIIAAADNTFSQSYTLNPGDSVQFTGVFDHLQTLSVEQVSTSADTIHLAWRKVSESVPLNWEALVCDNVMCNASLVDSGNMNPVLPGDYGFLLLHITPHVNYGTAVVRYAVWDIANATLKDTLTYTLTLDSLSGIFEKATFNSVQLYPNPANGNLKIKTNLEKGFSYSVCDMTGNELLKGCALTNCISVDTQILRCGTYVVIVEEKGISISNKTISIHR